MKNEKALQPRRGRYPVLRNLMLFQALLLLLGLSALGFAVANERKHEREAALIRAREALEPVLLSREQQWRSWKYMDLGAPLALELEDVRRKFRLASLEVLPGAEAPKRGDLNVLVVPPESERKSIDLAVVARFDPAQLAASGSTHPLTVYAFVFLSTLFVSMIIFSAYYIRLRIYQPLLALAMRSDDFQEGIPAADSATSARGEILEFINLIRRMHRTTLDAQREAAVGRLAAQIAHDIRSPLAALTMAGKDLASIPEENRLMISGAIGRIRDIANHLLETHRTDGKAAQGEPDSQLLSSQIDTILSEKRMQFGMRTGIEIEGLSNASSYGLFARVSPTEFKRVLSNLLNNSVEALGNRGKVTVALSAKDDQIEIRVTDNGRGIPPEILPRLGQRGETHGKEEGSGLGLHHARTSVESWGGKLEIQSEQGRGTAVTLTLPAMEPPAWFVQALRLTENSEVAVLDDDPNIFRIWQGRAESSQLNARGIKLTYLSTPAELRTWSAKALESGRVVKYLLDYEILGFRETGLDLIEELGIAGQSILVTSRHEETFIRDRCLKLRVPLIPKGMAGFVPIVVEGFRTPQRADAVLIDDDFLVHQTWELAAKRAGIRLAAFRTAEDFFAHAENLNRATPVYVDSLLGKNSQGVEVRGEEVSQRIFELGFKRVFLATGMSPANPESLTWLTGIRGKEPPFPEAGVRVKSTSVAATNSDPDADDRLRSYFHDLIKPVQQTVMLLRMIQQSEELTELLPLLDQIKRDLSAISASQDARCGQMTAEERRKIAVAQEKVSPAQREVGLILALSSEEIARLKASGELARRLEFLSSESSRLTQALRGLLQDREGPTRV